MKEVEFWCGTPLLQERQSEWYMSLSEKDKKKSLNRLTKLYEKHISLKRKNKKINEMNHFAN